MSRVLLVGPKDQLEPAIETLYSLRLVHLVDRPESDEAFSIGKPLPKAAEVSEDLVKLRSVASILRVEQARTPTGAQTVEDVRGRIVSLELNLKEDDEARKRIQTLLQDLDRQVEAIRPYVGFGLPLEMYRGYDSLDILVGRVTSPVTGLQTVAPEHELFSAEDAVAVFVPTNRTEAVREFLARFGFSPVELPGVPEGVPTELLALWEREREKWGSRLGEVERRLAKLRDKYARFLVRAEDALQVEIEKAEAPLRFTVSEHAFIVDGWVPTGRIAEIAKAFEALPGIHVDTLERLPEDEEHEGPPILLKNRKIVRPFEFITRLYSTPQHDEVDPTAFLFLLFPVFFGLMIGDVGYGIVMIILGFALSAKARDSPDFADLMRVILYGGVFAYIFGLLLYGEIFGIPFHPPPSAPAEITWSAILQYDIPYVAPIHKLETVGVIDLLLLSIVASFIHLTLGFVLGFVNEIHHDRKHAASRIGWLFVLFGLFAFFAVLGRTPEGVEPSARVVNQLFFDRPPLVWIPPEGIVQGGLTVPFSAVIPILIGIGILLPTEGLLAPMETISLLANMMSYTRLAGVAVAKGAVALAFNTMFLPLIIDETVFHDLGVVQWNPNIILIVIGFIFLFLAHAMVLVLGAISASIQAIRLNWVEFFLKFYKGGGREFSPFGARTRNAEA